MRKLFCLQISVLFAWSALAQAENWWRVYGKIEPGGFAGGSYHGEEPLTEAQSALLKEREFDEWETYEDEFVRLQYPKHPELKPLTGATRQSLLVRPG